MSMAEISRRRFVQAFGAVAAASTFALAGCGAQHKEKHCSRAFSGAVSSRGVEQRQEGNESGMRQGAGADGEIEQHVGPGFNQVQQAGFTGP